MKNYSKAVLTVFVGIMFAVAGCTQPEGDIDSSVYNESMADSVKADHKKMKVNNAVAVIHSNSTEVSGWVTFTKANDGVQVKAELSGLSEGEHGFHIHAYGDCRADDYSSAGGHFNPTNEQHGAPTDSVRHMGDMGNITADAEGTATMDYVDSAIKMHKIIGRAVVVHQGADDLSSQPSGAAGPRIACGVIGIANTSSEMGSSTTAKTDTADTSNMDMNM